MKSLQKGGESFQEFICKSRNEVESLQYLCRNIFFHKNDLRTVILKLSKETDFMQQNLLRQILKMRPCILLPCVGPPSKALRTPTWKT